MKENIEIPNETTTSNSTIIQLQDAHITHLMTIHYTMFTKNSPNYSMADSEDEEYLSTCIVQQRLLRRCLGDNSKPLIMLDLCLGEIIVCRLCRMKH